jgi:hypothetical protein
MQKNKSHAARSMVMCIARQGIYINRTADQQNRLMPVRVFISIEIGTDYTVQNVIGP